MDPISRENKKSGVHVFTNGFIFLEEMSCHVIYWVRFRGFGCGNGLDFRMPA